jgi:hypothetical protein
MIFTTVADAFAQLGDFSLAPFDRILQPLIEQVLTEQGKAKYRKGTILIPHLLVWLVLTLTLHRDLNCQKVLNWLVSGFRWMYSLLPAQSKLVQDGAISHARVALGVTVFRTLFARLICSFQKLESDFHGWISVAFDGSTGTMPDTEANVAAFHKPRSGRGTAAFPQLRMMTLMALSVRLVLDIAYAPYCGKGTGERALVREILAKLDWTGLLFLLDAGLYAIDILWDIDQKRHKFIVKASRRAKFKPIETFDDGSFLARLTHKIPDPDAPTTKSGRQRWKKMYLDVRVIRFQIPGFRPVTLVTNILDPTITAREIALHYHQRWDIEIAYDEIKTHQCATLRGQSPTTFRSKRPDLVKQELYALLIMYNAVRLLIYQAAVAQDKDPRFISFLDALQHIIDAAPMMTADASEHTEDRFRYLLMVIADCDIDRPRRQRINPRVVKIKMSKFKRKNKRHKSENRDIEKELKILPDRTYISLESDYKLARRT